MASYPGAFQLIGGGAPQQGPCTLSFDEEGLQVVAGGRPVLACDLGDIDVFAPGDHVLDLTLWTGQHLQLQRFGKPFDTLVHDLLEAHRARFVQCLLLEDLEETARFAGTLQYHAGVGGVSAPAEIRLYRSNVAFLPTSAAGFQWRLSDIDCVEFDAATYVTAIRSGDQVAMVGRLAKRTEEFRDRLQAAITQLADQSARVLRDLVPSIGPERFPALAAALKEGHSTSLATLNAIDTQASAAIVANVVDATLRPYYDALARLSGEAGVFTGFKMIRPETDAGDASSADGAEVPESFGDQADAPAAGVSETVLCWFVFHIAPPAAREPMLAWEATSRGGRATYVFKVSALDGAGSAVGGIDRGVERLGRGLALVNFRREPIYLPESSLQMQPRFRRYAIACRRLPDLGVLRKAFVGRAIHSSPDAWRAQLDALLTSR
jgi:hypothetical protein